MLTSLKKTMQRVMDLLTERKELRDSDNKLIATIWREDIKSLNLAYATLSAHDLLKLLADNKLTSPESIRRDRQIIMAKPGNNHLQGKSYKPRKKHGNEIAKEIHALSESAI